ncbi:cytochrome P450 82A1-like [Manihot esculenta]|uniref:cytochrome P450 82A1-like n=1 Tax=Manihot esculenta TaxID=3983 RepID=UPI001CC7C782|nr:cytochrome P450 82A1-like [Manihot esculenta]
MDYLSPFLNTTIVAWIFVSLFLPLYLLSLKKWESRASKAILAPQPTGAWPLTGHFSLFSGSEPHVTLGTLADKYGPIFTVRVGAHPVLVVSSSEVAKEIFTGINDMIVTFRPALVAAKFMGYNYAFFPVNPGGPYWSETRKLSIFELLSNRRLELLKHIRIQEVESSMKELMIIGKKYFGGGAVGEEKERRNKFQHGITKLFYFLGTLVLRDAVPFLGWMDVGGHEKAMKKIAKEIDDVLEKWLQEHKRNRCLGEESKEDQDFMEVMLSILDDKNLEGYDADTINKATSLGFNPKQPCVIKSSKPWLFSYRTQGQMLQQRGLNALLNVPPVAEGFNATEPQSTFNYQIPQHSSQRAGERSGGAARKDEPAVKARGQRVREFIESDEAESYSAGTAGRMESEEWEEGYRLE